MSKQLNTNVVINSGFTVILLILIVMISTNIHIINQNNKTIASINLKQQQAQDIFAMRNVVQKRAILIFQMMVTDDIFERDDMYTKYSREVLTFIKALARLRKNTPRYKDDWDKIQKLATKGRRIQDEAAELIYVEDMAAAHKMLYSLVVPSQNNVIKALTLQREKQQTFLNNEINNIQQLNIKAYWTITVVGVVAILLSILIAIYVSRHSKKTSNLEVEKKLAEEANVAKSEFLANMSHELRTPIHAIISFSQFGIEKKSASREKIEGFFKNINISGARLLRLVSDLLDLAKLESGKTVYNFKQSDLALVIQDAINSVSPLAQEKQLNIINNVSADVKKIYCDEVFINQVFLNLLSNAIKFSHQYGNIIIEGAIHIDKKNKKEYIRFSVEDEGIGIPADELDSVFDKFIQSSATKTGGGGTGLGLSICAKIIKSHSGNIWAEADKKNGAHFIFEIPVDHK